MSQRRGILIVVTALAIAQTAIAMPVPPILNAQGVLRDGAGGLQDGMFSMTFRLYDAQTAGTMLWQEVLPGVVVQSGVFSTYLGRTTAIDPSIFATTTTVWLGVTVEGDAVELSRQQLSATPFALQCEHSNAAEHSNTADDAASLGGVAASGWQRRQTTPCSPGRFVVNLNADGTPVCAAAPTAPTITTYTMSNRVASCQVTASCNNGDALVGGGCSAGGNVSSSYPSGAGTWMCAFVPACATCQCGQATAFAICQHTS